jgi:hypothetical protein
MLGVLFITQFCIQNNVGKLQEESLKKINCLMQHTKFGLLRLIHTYHAISLPRHQVFRLCLSHLIYTVRLCLIRTCHAVPMLHLCYATTFLKATSQGHGTAQHGHGMACVS